MEKSKPFCYGCYKEAPTGVCCFCRSDDLMRLVDGVGVEYGIDWVVKHLVQKNIERADTETAFEQYVSNAYPETIKAGWMNLDTISVMKTMDPIWWKMAHDEHIENDLTDEILVTFDNGSSYYRTADIKTFLEQNEY